MIQLIAFHKVELTQYCCLLMRHIWLSEGNKTNTKFTPKLVQCRFNSLDNPELDMSPIRILRRLKNKKHHSISITPQTLRQTILTVLKESFHLISPSFEALCLRWVQLDWTALRTDIQSRLNKLMYLQPTLKFNTFAEIEEEIKIQWSKSLILKGIHLLWNHWFKTEHFANLEQLQTFYKSICCFITKVTLYLYRNCLQNLISKQYPVQRKINLQTAVSIITENAEWTNIYNSVLRPHFIHQQPCFPQNYSLETLEINPNILDINKKESMFQKTAKSLQNFTQALTIPEMVSNLKQFRQNLQKQIQHSIQLQQSRNNINQSFTVAKEETLTVIVFILIKHKLTGVSAAIRYMDFLLSQQAERVMEWHKTNCWKANLQVACQFLVQPQIKRRVLKTELETNQQ